MANYPAIITQELGRVYKLRGPKRKDDPKELIALDGVNLEVPCGELFGLLGPQPGSAGRLNRTGPIFANTSNAALLGILAAFTAVLLVGSIYFYRWALASSKEQGLLDMKTGY